MNGESPAYSIEDELMAWDRLSDEVFEKYADAWHALANHPQRKCGGVMNILILAEWDHSGAGNALMHAVNECTEHEARQVAYEDSYLQYPCDVFRPTPQELQKLWDWADMVNLHDGAYHLIPDGAEARPIVSSYHGSTYRNRWPYYNEVDRQSGNVATAFNIDLVMLGPRWLPRAVPDMMDKRWRQSGAFRVAHAPTSRRIKDTETVLGAVKDIPGVELVLIEHTSNADCLQIKAGCDLLIEEFQLGYGTNAVECWAMGLPVISHAIPGILMEMRERLHPLPFVDTPLEELRERVIQLRDDKNVYKEAARRGRSYWADYHQPQVIARQFIEMCEERLERWEN
jgi:hypothetical protein